jgi:uncharacterized protein
VADVRDAPDQRRYEVYDDAGALAGFTTYATRPGKIIFVHTEVDPAFEGQGLGSALVKSALDDARARGLRVVPLCPFVAAYVERHPEYDDLVDHAALDALDRPV